MFMNPWICRKCLKQLLPWLRVPGALLVEVCQLRAFCSVVEAIRSVCPVVSRFCITAVCRNDILARIFLFVIAESVQFILCLFSWFILFVTIAFCTRLGSFEYCSYVENLTVTCCAISHISAKPTSSPDCSTHQWGSCATSASAASLGITFLSKITRTAVIFWQNWWQFCLIVRALSLYLLCVRMYHHEKSTCHQFASLLLNDDAAIWHNT